MPHAPPTLVLEEHPSTGYAPRTAANARAAHLTVAFAVDFTTAGERLTEKTAGGRYLPIDIRRAEFSAAHVIVESLTRRGGNILNVAGNGAHTLGRHNCTQAQINEYIFWTLSRTHALWPLRGIVCGGQTGADIAGAAAGLVLGLSVHILMPGGYLQRFADGQDVRVGRAGIIKQLERYCADLEAADRKLPF